MREAGTVPREQATAASPEAGDAATHEDLALVARLLARDEQAFTTLIDLHHASLLRLAMVFVSSRGAAEEIVQDTWVAVLGGLAKFEGRSSLKTWIFRILTNRAKTRGIRESRVVPFSSLLEPGEEDHEPVVEAARFQGNGMWGDPPRRWEDDTPERLCMTQQAVDRLEGALAALPPQQRAVVTLRDIEGLDSNQVCNVLEISETNQRVLLHRARSKLRSILEQLVDRS